MIMMTTEEERRNSERVKGSSLNHELRNVLGDIQVKQFHVGDKEDTQRRSVPNNYITCQQMFDFAKQSREKLSFSGDDGYSTDSRSNTTASSSSPLSSSLSSLSTFEGSPYSGGINSVTSHNPNYGSFINSPANMQRGPIQKGPSIHSNSRASSIYKHGGAAAKRRDVHVKSPDNVSSLEDRLRALTTIEEEGDSGISAADRSMNRHGVGKLSETRDHFIDAQPSPRDLRYVKKAIENPVVVTSVNEDFGAPSVYGFFRAVPVTVVDTDPPVEPGQPYQRDSGSNRGLTPSSHTNGEGWKDYTRFFEKDCDIPIHNLDPAGRGKFSNSSVDDVPDMDINRQIRTGSPAHSRKQMFNFTGGERMVIAPGRSETALNRLGPRDAGNPEEGPHRVPNTQGSVRYRPDAGFGSVCKGMAGLHQAARQHRVMSSMPDLRYQDPSWTPVSMSGATHRSQPANYPEYLYHVPEHQDKERRFSGSNYPFLSQEHQQKTPSQPEDQYFQQLSMINPAMDAHDPSMGSSRDEETRDSNVALAVSYPEVALRRSHIMASARATQSRPDRYSWQPGSSYDQQHFVEFDMPNSSGIERSSLDLGNIPQLQKQIRATSEMCLQASRRHQFASSADIYKLFSGQKKPQMSLSSPSAHSPSIKSRSNSCRHSFHAVPGSSWPVSSQMAAQSSPTQASPQTKPKLRVMMPSMSTIDMSSPGPAKADHNINIPPEMWTRVTSLPSSAASEIDRYSLQRQPQSLPVKVEINRPAYQRPSSASAELGLEVPQFQRQSSGYSSETELQQIESNARAIKKLQKRQGKQRHIDTHPQEFIPLNRSIDHDSNTGTDNADDLADNEPVYVNQAMLTQAHTFDGLNKSSTSDWFLPASSLIHQTSSIPLSDQLMPQQSKLLSQSFASGSSYNTSNTPTCSSNKTNNNRNNNNNNNSNNNNNNTMYSDSMITQHQIIKFNNKPITITSHIPSSPYGSQQHHHYHDHQWQQQQKQQTNDTSNSNIKTVNVHSSSFTSSPANIHPSNFPDQQRPGSHEVPYPYEENAHKRTILHQPDLSLPSHGGCKTQQGDCSPSHPSQSMLPRRTGSSSSVKFSPVEIAEMLDVPFATNIISDDEGDRLSTLV